MFTGICLIRVSADGGLSLPSGLIETLDQRSLKLELLRHADGTAIIALPGSPEDGSPVLDGRLRIPSALLVEAAITDMAEVEGMGAYLIIRRARPL